MKIYRDLYDETFMPSSIALGQFDGLHKGHQAVLKAAVVKAEQEGLIPSVFTFQESPAEIIKRKSVPRLVTESNRLKLLENFEIKQFFLLQFLDFKELTAEEFTKHILRDLLRAKKVTCGFNFHFGKHRKANSDTLNELCKKEGIEVELIPAVKEGNMVISSSQIRHLLQTGQINKANKMLGRAFSFDFKVITGRQLGRTLGIPTINQAFPVHFIIPLFGVYIARVQVHQSYYIGLTNIGTKPTVGSNKVLAETWIRHYQGNLYGQKIQVELLHYIRPEKKFHSLDKLKEAIFRDSNYAEKYIKQLI